MRACIVPSSVVASHGLIMSPIYYLGRRRQDKAKAIARLEAQLKTLKEGHTAEDIRVRKLK